MELVVLPGWGQSSDDWKDFCQIYGKGVRVIDLPGFGKQKLINEDWGVPEYAEWVESRIKKHDSVILGHSFGGRIAVEIAKKNPSWLKGLVLSGSPCIYRPSWLTKIKKTIFRASSFFIGAGQLENFLPGDLLQARQWKMEKIFRKVVSFDQTEGLRKIEIPTLIIWGQHDNEVPVEVGKSINFLIKNSTLEVIEDVGHNSFVDNPYLFLGYVKKFIRHN